MNVFRKPDILFKIPTNTLSMLGPMLARPPISTMSAQSVSPSEILHVSHHGSRSTDNINHFFAHVRSSKVFKGFRDVRLSTGISVPQSVSWLIYPFLRRRLRPTIHSELRCYIGRSSLLRCASQMHTLALVAAGCGHPRKQIFYRPSISPCILIAPELPPFFHVSYRSTATMSPQ